MAASTGWSEYESHLSMMTLLLVTKSFRDLIEPAGDKRRFGAEEDGVVGVLQAVAGQNADDDRTFGNRAGLNVFDQPGHRGGRGRLAEDPFFLGDNFIGVNDFFVGHDADRAARFLGRGFGSLPAGGGAYAGGGGQRLPGFDLVPAHDRGGPLGLKADHLGQRGNFIGGEIFFIALPVGSY